MEFTPEERGAERILHMVDKWKPENFEGDAPLSRKKGGVIAYYADGPQAGRMVVVPDDCDYVVERDGTVYA